MTHKHPDCWAVIPAAGAGRRMGNSKPKQYLTLAGKTILEHSLTQLLDMPEITGAVVAISDGDTFWSNLNIRHEKTLIVAPGGQERCDSVLSALEVLSQSAEETDWVLVHDAARPCVRQEDINKLITICIEQGQGGILAVPVKDTIKRASDSADKGIPEIMETVDRSKLWHAQTPQMFRLGELRDNLVKAIDSGVVVTDEASAMEWAGTHPLLVEGHADNIKITHKEDMDQALCFFNQEK